MKKVEITDKKKSGEIQVFSRCDRCFGEIYRGEFCYRMGSRLICQSCLPELAEELLLPFRVRWGQEG